MYSSGSGSLVLSILSPAFGTKEGMLNANETAVCNFSDFIGALNVGLSRVILSAKYSFSLFTTSLSVCLCALQFLQIFYQCLKIEMG